MRLIDLRPGEGRIAAEGHLLTLGLLPVDLGLEQFLPTVGTVDVVQRSFQSPLSLNSSSG